MSIQPDYITIGDLFVRNFIFRVPRYQRGYAWEDAETDDFIRDIDKCYNARVDGTRREHFFGGIVSVKRKVVGSSGHHCDLIDGQQRVATFVLLASCIVTHLDQIAAEAKDVGDQNSSELACAMSEQLYSKYLKLDDVINREPKTIDRLELSDPDQSYFSQLIQHDSVPRCPDIDSRKSHHRLWHAYHKLYTDLQEAIERCDAYEDKIEVLAKVGDILQEDATVINIVTDEQAEAYRLFQVLNNRGTKLTEGDLLRASTLELLGTTDLNSQHESAAVLWDDILQYDPGYTQNFLGWYYASTQGERAGQSSLFDEFFDALFPQHTSAPLSVTSAKTVVKAIEEIQRENTLCRQILDSSWPYASAKANRWEIERLQLLINSLSHTACIPLLMSAAQLKEKDFVEVVSLIERFSFRYKSICNLHIGSLQKVYHDHALQIRNNPKVYKVSSLQTDFRELQNKKATDTLFSTSLSESLSYQQSSGNKLLKYFLSTLEHYWRWYEDGAQGNLRCKEMTRVFDLSSMTLEHIYPQKPKPKDRVSSVDSLVNKLGNLTLLSQSENEAIGNKPFSEKNQLLAQSSLKLNQLIGANNVWKKRQIQDREKDLISAALAIFSM